MKNLYEPTTKEAPHKNLRRRMGVAFVSGCLALSMCPALAMAQPGGSEGSFNPNDQTMGQMQQPPAPPEGNAQMPQGEFGGPSAQQPPAMNDSQAPTQGQDGNSNGIPTQPNFGNDQAQQPGKMPEDANGQQPSQQPGQALANGSDQQPGQENQGPQGQPANQGQPGQPGQAGQPGQPGQPRTDELDAKVKGILESYGIELPAAPNASQQPDGSQAPGNPGEAPELPEGAVNVQQVIDTMRDILHEYSVNDLESNINDETFVTTLKAYAQTATAQRLAMFASNERPSMEAPSDIPAEGDQSSSSAPATTMPGEGASDALLNQICSLIMDVFGYVS